MPVNDRLIMLPPKGRVILALHDDTTPDVPRVILPEDVAQPPIFIPAPTRPVPPLPPSLPPVGLPAGRPVIDVIAQMPRLPQGPAGQTDLHDSLTFHWNGANFSRSASDDECFAALVQIAFQHQRKDWSSDGSGAFGDTIMYHEAICPSGTVYVMREYSEVAWHSGIDRGNRTSRGILVLSGPDTEATSRQLEAMTLRYQDFQLPPIWGHQEWSATACPGPRIMAHVRVLRA
jgi:hypothetical protein